MNTVSITAVLTLLLGMSMLATTIGLYLIPFCKPAALLIAMMSVFGVSFGALDTG